MPQTPNAVKTILILACLVAAFAIAACRARGENRANQKRYELKGRVVSVDDKGKQLIIAHEEIKDLMSAMTMGFNVKDESVLRDARPGDEIQAELVIEGDRSWLENVILTSASADDSAKVESNIEPQPGDEVADFALVNQDGKPISIHQYRGRALVLTFIYTRCPVPDYCPLMSMNFAAIEKSLADDPELYQKTHLLSITVDPDYDTPQMMREYGALYAEKPAAFAHWEFATGSAEQVKKIASYFGLQYWQEEDQIIHSLRTAVIAPDGKLVKLYRGNEWKPEQVLADLRAFKYGE
ncbi:MAG TPA: SCO family protein [Blastocatellia bacterium]|nr:SCO family protein [Blastocatellia bacterium]